MCFQQFAKIEILVYIIILNSFSTLDKLVFYKGLYLSIILQNSEELLMQAGKINHYFACLFENTNTWYYKNSQKI